MLRYAIGMGLFLLATGDAVARDGTSAAQGWQALVETARDGRTQLHVEGEVKAAETAKPSLNDNQFQGINPAILFLELKMPRGVGAKRFKPVHFERRADRINVTEVDIFRDGAMIARIPVKRRH